MSDLKPHNSHETGQGGNSQVVNNSNTELANALRSAFGATTEYSAAEIAQLTEAGQDMPAAAEVTQPSPEATKQSSMLRDIQQGSQPLFDADFKATQLRLANTREAIKRYMAEIQAKKAEAQAHLDATEANGGVVDANIENQLIADTSENQVGVGVVNYFRQLVTAALQMRDRITSSGSWAEIHYSKKDKTATVHKKDKLHDAANGRKGQ